MYKCINGRLVELTAEEVAEAEAQAQAADREYWSSIHYDEAVNAEIRKGYTESQEFAILRQKDEKPEEYARYFAYCESCKAYAKQKKEEYAWQ